MYRWKLTSFVIFSSMFWTVSMASASLTWFLLNLVMRPEPVLTDEIKDEEHGIKDDEHKIVKEESEMGDIGSSSGAVKVKEEPEEQGSSSLLQGYLAGDEGGIGSGLEDPEGRGLQKRRSHLSEYDS